MDDFRDGPLTGYTELVNHYLQMPGAKAFHDGPHSPQFRKLRLHGNVSLDALRQDERLSQEMAGVLEYAPRGECVGWGVPFDIDEVVTLIDEAITVELEPTAARWFIFMHTSDRRPHDVTPSGFISPMRGQGQLGEHAADYIMIYEDGEELRLPIRRRYQIGTFLRRWGENCFEAVAHRKPTPRRPAHEEPTSDWGLSQFRLRAGDQLAWANWLWAWENPHPDKAIVAVRFEPVSGIVIISALAAGDASSQPFRWRTRRKALLPLPPGETFQPELDDLGLLKQIQLDMGQVISATPRSIYPNQEWERSYNNQIPEISENELLIEYTSHADARFHLSTGQSIPVAQVESQDAGSKPSSPLQVAPLAQHKITLRVKERGSDNLVSAKLHIHDEWGDYLAPVDRNRIPNPSWFEDYSVDFVNQSWEHPERRHFATYIPGETTLYLPQGKVYIEVSKGFEIRPVRKVVEIRPDTEAIEIEIEKVLPWREQGWVTADTHVHFLSPTTALLEGSAEGVNIINLLASQWGELMTNVGDFDGRTTWKVNIGGREGEWMVRVGTENRQHLLGHISLLGYQGNMITPLATGGPDEAAFGDPVAASLTEWARQCRKQGGLVVIPHFPDPRAEAAATITEGDADAIEMTSWGDLYYGIDPYSLSDWYRFLNCGYLVPAVGGTDKMTATTAVGAVRTYARIAPNTPFTYETWMEAVRRKETFVTYGPLLEFSVDGQPMGSVIQMSANGGTVDVTWQVASVTIPMTRVELIVNGEIREGAIVGAEGGAGHWSVQVNQSSWLALLVRGHYPDKPEIIAAHSTPVMAMVAGSPMLAATDAVTILEQIEGAMAYLDTVGVRPNDRAYKRMRLILTTAHRRLHNRMHQLGYYHEHTPATNHPEHSD